MFSSYEDFIANNYSTEQSKDIIKKPEETKVKCTDLEYWKMFLSFETMYTKSLKMTEKTTKSYSLEAEDDPFADLGDGLDGDGDLPAGDDASFGDGGDDVSFDSFEDTSGSIFGDDFGSDMSGEDSDGTKSKALEVSRSDLLDESHNLGMYVRRVIPKKIHSLMDIIDFNIEIVNKGIQKYGKSLDDFILVKESYSEIKDNINEYLEIIDSKTFEEMFSDYIVFLSLIDKVNDMYQNLLKHLEKQ